MKTIIKIEDLIVNGVSNAYFTPDVQMSASTESGYISGESYLENSFAFYDQIINWLQEYFFLGGDKFTLDIKLTYFNTSSSRALVDLFRFLQEQKEQGKNIVANWHFPDPDDGEIMLEAEDFMEESGLEINIIEYSDS